MIIEELIAILGFEVRGTENVKKATQAVKESRKEIGLWQAGLAGFAGGFAAGFVQQLTRGVMNLTRQIPLATKRLNDLNDSAERIGVHVETLQEWGHAATLAGGSTERLAATMEQLVRVYATAARGMGRGKQALEAYGLGATDAAGNIKKADDILLELAATFDRVSEAEQLDIARYLRLDPATVTMLKTGRREIERTINEARELGLVFDKHIIEGTKQWNDNLDRIKAVMNALTIEIALMLVPALQRGTDQFLQWYKVNKDWVRLGIEQTLKGISRGLEGISRVTRMAWSGLERLGDALGRLGFWDNEAGAGVPLAGKALLVALAKRYPILLLFLFLEDLATHQQGGKSVIGDALNWIKKLGGEGGELEHTTAAVNNFGEAWTNLSSTLGMGFPDLKLDLLKSTLREIETILTTIERITKAFKGIPDAEGKSGGIWSYLFGFGEESFQDEWIRAPFRGFRNAILGAWDEWRSENTTQAIRNWAEWLLGLVWSPSNIVRDLFNDLTESLQEQWDRFMNSSIVKKLREWKDWIFKPEKEKGPAIILSPPRKKLSGQEGDNESKGSAGKDRLQPTGEGSIANMIQHWTASLPPSLREVFEPPARYWGGYYAGGAVEGWNRLMGRGRGGGRGGYGGGGPTGSGQSGYMGGGPTGGSASDYSKTPALSGPSGPPGTYRPYREATARDLDQAVVNTIAGEVSTKSQSGVDAVINNMLNRVGAKGAWYGGENLYDVARQRGQYEGYREATPKETEFIRSRIKTILSGSEPDITGGANEFRASWYRGPWQRKHFASGTNIAGNVYAKTGPIGPYAAYKTPKVASASMAGMGGTPDEVANKIVNTSYANRYGNTNNTTTITAPVSVTSPNPEAAGKAVAKHVGGLKDQSREGKGASDFSAYGRPMPDGPVNGPR